jgi:hypothetical protein
MEIRTAKNRLDHGQLLEMLTDQIVINHALSSMQLNAIGRYELCAAAD